MKFLATLLALALPHLIMAQKIATQFEEIEKKKGSVKALEALYPSALSSDSAKAVFRGREKEFYQAYVTMLTDWNGYLKNNGFRWGKTTRCFNRICINKDGSIGYFLFHFDKGVIDKPREEEFKKLLNVFIQSYQFPLESKSNFAQCSPVVYMDQ